MNPNGRNGRHSMCAPLWVAARHGHVDIMKLLIDFGANVNEEFCDFGYSFFHHLAFLSNTWKLDKKVAQILIKRGANVNIFSKSTGKIPIQVAIENGNVNYVKFLLENGANLQGPGWGQDSPMYFALKAPKTKRYEMLEFLTTHGIDIGLRNKEGNNYTYFHYVANKEHTDWEKDKKLVEYS